MYLNKYTTDYSKSIALFRIWLKLNLSKIKNELMKKGRLDNKIIDVDAKDIPAGVENISALDNKVISADRSTFMQRINAREDKSPEKSVQNLMPNKDTTVANGFINPNQATHIVQDDGELKNI